MSPSFLAGLAGGLVICLVISRLARRILFKKASGFKRLLGPNGVALALATLLGGFGMADGGSPQFVTALAQYLPAVLLVVVIDLVAMRRAAPPASG